MFSANANAPQTPRSRTGGQGLGGWWFLLLTVLLHLGVYLTDSALSAQSLGYFRDMLQSLLPAFGVMFLLLWLFNLLSKPQQLIRRLSRQSSVRAWFLSIAGGVLSLGPMVIWYPLLKQLRDQGMRSSLLAAFLYSRAIKIPMLPIMMHYFGVFYTGLFVSNILLFSLLNGVIMGYVEGEDRRH